MKEKNNLTRLFGETLFNKIAGRLISYTAILLIFSLVIVLLVDIKQKTTTPDIPIVELSKVTNIPEESLYIEWLNNNANNDNKFDEDKRTVIVVHGETPQQWDSKFSMILNENDYVYYKDNSAQYNVETSANIDRRLYKYWLDQDYNVGIFHYEKFSDDTMEMLQKKLYNKIEMRYMTESGINNSKTPNYSLTEIMAAAYLSEIPEQAYGNEIRIVGNGIGANLALSFCDYLYAFYNRNALRQEILPHRLSLIDPYLSPEKFNNNIEWRDVPQSLSMLELTNSMLDYTTNLGLVCDMVENVEVTAIMENGVSVDKLITPYDYQLSEQEIKIKDSIKEQAAYLLLRQKYSSFYSENYRKQNRAGLDWYLYSINGSDDTNVGSPNYDYANYDSTSNCNWGRYSTRPMLNNRQKSNKSTDGKNYSVSAWTETVWTRALKGIEFNMKQSTGVLKDDNTTLTDMHGNTLYDYKDYNLTKFRSENYQYADFDRTIVAGYIWNDKNEDRIMNEGIASYLGGIQINVTLSTTTSGETKTVDTFSVVTENDGFFKIEFNCAFVSSHSVNLTVIPPNSLYHVQEPGKTTYHVAELTRHTFNKNSKSITITKSYGSAITMLNCGLVVKR